MDSYRGNGERGRMKSSTLVMGRFHNTAGTRGFTAEEVIKEDLKLRFQCNQHVYSRSAAAQHFVFWTDRHLRVVLAMQMS